MDWLRGFAVSLVLFYHASLVSITDPHFGAMIGSANGLLAPLRMPTMVFLSGLLVPRSMAKGARNFVAGKVRNIAYPCALWSVIMIVLWTFVLNLMPFSPRRVIELLWQPFDHLWFLYHLFAYYLLALATKRFRPLLVSAATLILALTFAAITNSDKEFLSLATFFMLGVDAATHATEWTAWLRERLARLLVLFSTAALVAMSVFDWGASWFKPVLIPLQALTIAGLVSLLIHRCPLRWRVFESIGRDSLVYYLAHWPVLMVLRSALAATGSNDLVRLVASLVVAFGTCWLLASLRSRSRVVALLFSWPRRRDQDRIEQISRF